MQHDDDDQYDAYNMDAVHKLLDMSAPPRRQAEAPISYEVQIDAVGSQEAAEVDPSVRGKPQRMIGTR